MKTERWVVCEGFHDRAMWGGLLKHLGCKPGDRASKDSQGYNLSSGTLLYKSGDKIFIQVIPAAGNTAVLPTAWKLWRDKPDRNLELIVLCTDSDASADETQPPKLVPNFASVVQRARSIGSLDMEDERSGTIIVNTGEKTCKIRLVNWSVSDAPTPDLPSVQTLDRVLCSAIKEVHPQRCEDVRIWRANRRDPPPIDPKEHTLSHLAGWYAEQVSYEGLCGMLWGAPAIKAAMLHRLEACGVMAAARELTSRAGVI